MKLSFSTNRWKGFSLNEFFDIAREYRFDGIEIHSVNECADENLSSVYHKLMEKRLQVSCIDLVTDIGDADNADKAYDELCRCIDASIKLRSPYIRLKVMKGDSSFENARAFVERVLPLAKKSSVALLVETVGEFADTAHLREFLNVFASGYLGALWDLHYPYTVCSESPDETIKNLGAYVKHVHMKDSEDADSYTLVGEGKLPIPTFMDALRSVNYNKFISIEWDPEWISEVGDFLP